MQLRPAARLALTAILGIACASCSHQRSRIASDAEKDAVARALIPIAPIGAFGADWRTYLRERNVIVIAGAEVERLEVQEDGVSGSFGFTYRVGSFAGELLRGNACAFLRPGYFLTCAHVVDRRPITVIVPGGSWPHALAEVVWWDRAADLAIIRAPIAAPALFELAAEPPQIGAVMVAGSSQGPSAGHVIGSAAGEIVCDLPTKPGDSGGALVDASGRLVGVVTRVGGPGPGVHLSAILSADSLDRIVADAARAAGGGR
jgi:S1-C subfamily serine protease